MIRPRDRECERLEWKPGGDSVLENRMIRSVLQNFEVFADTRVESELRLSIHLSGQVSNHSSHHMESFLKRHHCHKHILQHGHL